MEPKKRLQRINWRTKVLVVAVFLGVVLFAYLFGNPMNRYRESEAENCRSQCAQIKMSGRLVSQNPVGSVGPGRFDGPWRCECY